MHTEKDTQKAHKWQHLREFFGLFLGPDGNPCADRLFDIIDVDGSGGISFKEVCQGVANRRSMSTKEAKLHGNTMHTLCLVHLGM
jgi:Ca2+-binding EF-hand superfamily protein